MIKKLIEKFIKKQEMYLLLENDVEYLKTKIEDLKDEKNELFDKANKYAEALHEIKLITKKADARNKFVKEIKKVCQEVAKNIQ